MTMLTTLLNSQANQEKAALESKLKVMREASKIKPLGAKAGASSPRREKQGPGAGGGAADGEEDDDEPNMIIERVASVDDAVRILDLTAALEEQRSELHEAHGVEMRRYVCNQVWRQNRHIACTERLL